MQKEIARYNDLKTFNLTLSRDDETNEGEIDLYGYVYPGAFDLYDEFDAKMVKNALSEMDGVDVIHVHIHSPGGIVYEGLAIYDALKVNAAKIITYNDGLAASMGSILFMVGEERISRPNSVIMIHNPYGFISGDEHQLSRSIDVIRAHKEQMVNIYNNALGEGHGLDIAKMMDDETYIFTEQAIEEGWSNRIDGEDVLSDVAATMVTYGRDMERERVAYADSERRRRRPEPNDNNTGDDVMTKSELAALFAANTADFIAMFKDSDEGKALIKNAADEARKAERARIKDVMSLKRTGIEDFVNDLAFSDEGHTKAEASLLAWDELERIGADALAVRRSHNTVIQPESSERTAIPEGATDEDRFKAEYQADKDGCRTGPDSFMSEENYVAFMKGQKEGRFKRNTD